MKQITFKTGFNEETKDLEHLLVEVKDVFDTHFGKIVGILLTTTGHVYVSTFGAGSHETLATCKAFGLDSLYQLRGKKLELYLYDKNLVGVKLYETLFPGEYSLYSGVV